MARSKDSSSSEDGKVTSAKNGGRREIHVDEEVGNGFNSGSKVFLSVDEILVQHVGELGRAQVWHFVLANSAWIVHALHMMIMIFSDRVPEWRCLPQLDNGEPNNSCLESSSLCNLPPGVWEWVGGRSISTVSEWNLICGDEYKAGLAGSLFFLGILIGAGIYGNLSDSVLGRKGALVTSSMIACVLGLLASMAPTYWVYAALRFGTGLNCGGIGLCCYVLAMEVIGPNKRAMAGIASFYFFSVGTMVLPAFAYFSTSWRYLYAVCSIPGFAYCALVLPFLWESPRWYLVKGRVPEAMQVLRAFARRNGNVVPENIYLRLIVPPKEETLDETLKLQLPIAPVCDTLHDSTSPSTPLLLEESEGKSLAKVDGGIDGLQRKGRSKQTVGQAKGTLLDVFRNRETRWRMLLMIFIWFCTAMVYYGLNFNAGNLGANLYVSVFLNGLIEVPASAMTSLLLLKVRRKKLLVGNMALSGVCCLMGGLFFVLYPPDGSSSTANSQDLRRFPEVILDVTFSRQVGPPRGGTCPCCLHVYR